MLLLPLPPPLQLLLLLPLQQVQILKSQLATRFPRKNNYTADFSGTSSDAAAAATAATMACANATHTATPPTLDTHTLRTHLAHASTPYTHSHARTCTRTRLDLLVVDEAHMVADADRGALLELILAKGNV